MPYKNSLKKFQSNTYFHVYGRGINKMDIFVSNNDYICFLHILKKYLSYNFKEKKTINGQSIYVKPNSVYGLVELNAFTLMSNHFHFILKNIDKEGITKLMKRLLSNYVPYFNSISNRQGPLIQGGYRAVPIYSEEQLIQVSRYIHLNPVKAGLVKNCKDYKFTSFSNYSKNQNNSWLKLDPFIRIQTDFSHLENYLEKTVYTVDV